MEWAENLTADEIPNKRNKSKMTILNSKQTGKDEDQELYLQALQDGSGVRVFDRRPRDWIGWDDWESHNEVDQSFQNVRCLTLAKQMHACSLNDITGAANNSQEVITGACTEAGAEFEENGFVVVCYCSAYCLTCSILLMLMWSTLL
jgi:hypothetical protein